MKVEWGRYKKAEWVGVGVQKLFSFSIALCVVHHVHFFSFTKRSSYQFLWVSSTKVREKLSNNMNAQQQENVMSRRARYTASVQDRVCAAGVYKKG